MAQLQQDNLFFDVQQQVCKILNDIPELSAIDFFPSNNKDLETEITTSLRKQGVCGVVIIDEANFQGFESGLDTAWQIDNLVVQIIENPIINRANNNKNFLGTCQDIGSKVSQVLGGIEYGHHQVFNLKSYEEGEENGLLTSKISFQCLVTTNISSYVPPEDPTKRVPFATEPWVLSNFVPLSANSGDLSVDNLSGQSGNFNSLNSSYLTTNYLTADNINVTNLKADDLVDVYHIYGHNGGSIISGFSELYSDYSQINSLKTRTFTVGDVMLGENGDYGYIGGRQLQLYGDTQYDEEKGTPYMASEAGAYVEGTVEAFGIRIPAVMQTSPFNDYLTGSTDRTLTIQAQTNFDNNTTFNNLATMSYLSAANADINILYLNQGDIRGLNVGMLNVDSFITINNGSLTIGSTTITEDQLRKLLALIS